MAARALMREHERSRGIPKVGVRWTSKNTITLSFVLIVLLAIFAYAYAINISEP
jgi:hypothetical protein